MIKAALFDMDGTLVDSEILWSEALSLLLEEEGIVFSQKQCMNLAYSLAWADAYDRVQKRFPEKFSDITVQAAGQRLSLIFARLSSFKPPEIKCATDLLRRLHSQGLLIGVVSGSPRNEIERILEALQIRDLVTCIVSAESVPIGKPNPAGYLTALKQLSIDSTEAVAFEDSYVGTTAAHAAGIYTVGFRNPSSPPQTLTAADIILEDLNTWQCPNK